MAYETPRFNAQLNTDFPVIHIFSRIHSISYNETYIFNTDFNIVLFSKP